jgi:hypothetical protein
MSPGEWAWRADKRVGPFHTLHTVALICLAKCPCSALAFKGRGEHTQHFFSPLERFGSPVSCVQRQIDYGARPSLPEWLKCDEEETWGVEPEKSCCVSLENTDVHPALLGSSFKRGGKRGAQRPT